MTFKREDITVTIRTKPFDQSKYKIKRSVEGGHVVAIDGKPAFGRDGEMPRTAIRSVVITIGSDTFRLAPSQYANLFEPRI